MLCNQGESCGVAVEAVDAAEGIWDSLVIVIDAYSICKRMVVMIERWMNRHLRRFVYSEDILVFITDQKRHGDRQNMCGGSVFF